MYSEKLAKLIKDKAELKFRIKDVQQSKELQELLFTLGVGWEVSGKYFLGDNLNFMFVGSQNSYSITQCVYSETCCFLDSKNKEYDLENDCLVVEEKELGATIKTFVLFENPSREELKSLLEVTLTALKHIEENL